MSLGIVLAVGGSFLNKTAVLPVFLFSAFEREFLSFSKSQLKHHGILWEAAATAVDTSPHVHSASLFSQESFSLSSLGHVLAPRSQAARRPGDT